jgi:hypothetical protein
MPFSICPYLRFPVQCSVTYNAGPIPHAASGLLFEDVSRRAQQ